MAGWLPEPLVRAVGERAGRFAFKRAGRRRRMNIRHMARAVGSEREVESTARAAFGAYGRYWAGPVVCRRSCVTSTETGWNGQRRRVTRAPA